MKFNIQKQAQTVEPGDYIVDSDGNPIFVTEVETALFNDKMYTKIRFEPVDKEERIGGRIGKVEYHGLRVRNDSLVTCVIGALVLL